jgi:thioredoxin-related protein
MSDWFIGNPNRTRSWHKDKVAELKAKGFRVRCKPGVILYKKKGKK